MEVAEIRGRWGGSGNSWLLTSAGRQRRLRAAGGRRGAGYPRRRAATVPARRRPTVHASSRGPRVDEEARVGLGCPECPPAAAAAQRAIATSGRGRTLVPGLTAVGRAQWVECRSRARVESLSMHRRSHPRCPAAAPPWPHRHPSWPRLFGGTDATSRRRRAAPAATAALGGRSRPHFLEGPRVLATGRLAAAVYSPRLS